MSDELRRKRRNAVETVAERNRLAHMGSAQACARRPPAAGALRAVRTIGSRGSARPPAPGRADRRGPLPPRALRPLPRQGLRAAGDQPDTAEGAVPGPQQRGRGAPAGGASPSRAARAEPPTRRAGAAGYDERDARPAAAGPVPSLSSPPSLRPRVPPLRRLASPTPREAASAGGTAPAGPSTPAPPPARDRPRRARWPRPRTRATGPRLAHLSALIGLLVGFNFVGPLVVYLIKRDDDPYVRDQAAEALNFNLSVFLYAVVAGLHATLRAHAPGRWACC